MALTLAKNKIFIHAINVHQGGGRSLLCALIRSVNSICVLYVDQRMSLPNEISNFLQVTFVKPTILHRFTSEWILSVNADENDIVLCFGNLPPIYRLRAQTAVFLQNRYLIDDVSRKGLPLRVQLRLLVERWWLISRLNNVDEFVVQTPTMKSLLENKINGRVPVRILPFVADPSGYYHKLLHPIAENDWSYDFVYVASGESHKNHDTLIEAWCLLAREGLLPSLCLTLDKIRFPALCDQIEEIKKISAVNIINLGVLDPSEVLQLYARSHAAIYPSKLESFGLPLIEARQAGLPILASELDYVRDVVDPEQTFDPDSPMSIARAVKRFLGVEVTPIPLLSASQFLESVFNKPAVTNP